MHQVKFSSAQEGISPLPKTHMICNPSYLSDICPMLPLKQPTFATYEHNPTNFLHSLNTISLQVQNHIFLWRERTAVLRSKFRNNTGKQGQADRSGTSNLGKDILNYNQSSFQHFNLKFSKNRPHTKPEAPVKESNSQKFYTPEHTWFRQFSTITNVNMYTHGSRC